MCRFKNVIMDIFGRVWLSLNIAEHFIGLTWLNISQGSKQRCVASASYPNFHKHQAMIGNVFLHNTSWWKYQAKLKGFLHNLKAWAGAKYFSAKQWAVASLFRLSKHQTVWVTQSKNRHLSKIMRSNYIKRSKNNCHFAQRFDQNSLPMPSPHRSWAERTLSRYSRFRHCCVPVHRTKSCFYWMLQLLDQYQPCHHFSCAHGLLYLFGETTMPMKVGCRMPKQQTSNFPPVAHPGSHRLVVAKVGFNEDLVSRCVIAILHRSPDFADGKWKMLGVWHCWHGKCLMKADLPLSKSTTGRRKAGGCFRCLLRWYHQAHGQLTCCMVK